MVVHCSLREFFVLTRLAFICNSSLSRHTLDVSVGSVSQLDRPAVLIELAPRTPNLGRLLILKRTGHFMEKKLTGFVTT